VHDLVRADEALLKPAVRSNWPFAHAGLEPPRVREAAAAVRARLEREQDPGLAGKLEWAYAGVAARLNDAADVKAAAATLRARLERARDPWIAGGLAEAYAAVAGPAVERADAKDRSALVLDILVLAGHPFVMDASPLLSALKPATGEDFGANIGAAVRWAQQTYDIRPDRLRPPPP